VTGSVRLIVDPREASLKGILTSGRWMLLTAKNMVGAYTMKRLILGQARPILFHSFLKI
jgi:hypothetical protein